MAMTSERSTAPTRLDAQALIVLDNEKVMYGFAQP